MQIGILRAVFWWADVFISLTCGMYDPGNKLPRRHPWGERASPNILAVLASSFRLEVILSENTEKAACLLTLFQAELQSYRG